MKKNLLSGLDIIDMIGKMKREERITEEEMKVLVTLVAQYTFYREKSESKGDWGRPGAYCPGS